MQKIIKKRPLLTQEKLSDHPLLNRLYQSRGIQSVQELERTLKFLHRPQQLAGIEQAVEILMQAYKKQSQIVIVGDFDADGATSTALTLLALRQLGFTQVEYLIPDRFSQGYGLSLSVAEMVVAKGADLVITVDNGISSFEGIEYLKSQGIQVIVTDHHLPADSFPNADAMVNPNLPYCEFPSKSLAGVGVAFYVMLALRSKMREENLFTGTEPNLAELLDLVALGTVADVVPLDHNNRILVYQGLSRIRSGACRAGIKALAEVSKRDLSHLQAADVARQLAFEIDSLNQTRKEFEQEMKTEALSICAKLPKLSQKNQAHGITLYHPDWHQGVIGILASRIKDQFHRPVIAFAQESEESEFIKGSARSIAGLHMRDVLERIDTLYPDLIVKFGGHAMAAGLTIHQDHFLKFQKIFDEVINEMIEPELLQGIIYTDGELQAGEFSLKIANLLQQAGPWGQHFPEPTFEGDFKILQQRLLGGSHLKMMLENQQGMLLDAIWFNIDTRLFPDLSIKQAKIIYKLDINEYKGTKNLQLRVENVIV